MSSGCGCALTLVAFAVCIGVITVWAFLVETGLVYWLGAGLIAWVLLTIVGRIRRHWRSTTELC